jgi:hypothetical protein
MDYPVPGSEHRVWPPPSRQWRINGRLVSTVACRSNSGNDIFGPTSRRPQVGKGDASGRRVTDRVPSDCGSLGSVPSQFCGAPKKGIRRDYMLDGKYYRTVGSTQRVHALATSRCKLTANKYLVLQRAPDNSTSPVKTPLGMLCKAVLPGMCRRAVAQDELQKDSTNRSVVVGVLSSLLCTFAAVPLPAWTTRLAPCYDRRWPDCN